MPYADDPMIKRWKKTPEPKCVLVTSVAHLNSHGNIIHQITFGGKSIGLNGGFVSKEKLNKALERKEAETGHKVKFVQGPV